VIYRQVELAGFGGLWISAVDGGPPVRLAQGATTRDFAGSWSPDGKWYVYRHNQDGRESLNKVKTTGGAAPEVLKADTKRRGSNWVPVWSPAGDWILHNDESVKLISPDGQTTRDVSPTGALAYCDGAVAMATPGTRLGPYEVVAAIGAGGMGEVYRAKDTKLNRDVALKILPPSLIADPDDEGNIEETLAVTTRCMRYRKIAACSTSSRTFSEQLTIDGDGWHASSAQRLVAAVEQRSSK
jgi:hypothetical protein